MPVNPFLRKINQTPHAKKLNLQLISAEDNNVTLKLPFSEEIIGDPVNRFIHGAPLRRLLIRLVARRFFRHKIVCAH